MEDGDEDLMFLQVDLINAFNCCDRDSAFEVVEEAFPECLKWVLTCYGTEAELLFGNTIILSKTGFHQGDPLASFLFSLTLQPIITKIQQEIPDLALNEWYLDDGAVAGRKEQLQKVIDIVLQEGPARGLFLSTAASVTPPSRPKSTVWCPKASPDLTDLDPLRRGVPRVMEDGIVLLGSPIGSQEFIEQVIASKVEKVKETVSLLPLIQDPHTEYVLLRSCLSIPKIMFILRTTDPVQHQNLLQQFDSILRESLTRIIGVPVSDSQWQQAQLPVSMGGIGLRSAWDHAPAAFAISLLSAQDLKEKILNLPDTHDCPVNLTPPLLQYLTSKMGEEASAASLVGVSQKATSLKIDLHNHQLLTTHYSELGVKREIARLASLGLPHAGDWLNVIPSPALGLHIRPAEFSVSVKYRLGCEVFSTDGQCPACPRLSDALGDHAISCGYEGERIARHDHIRNALFHTAQQACLGPTREDRALLPGTEARPADVLIPHWTAGKDTALDVTVVNPLQDRLVNQAAVNAGHALNTAYSRKMTQTGEACRRAGIVFIPLPMETLGGWHEQTVCQVKKLGYALARHTGQDENEAIRHFSQRLAVW